MSEHLRTGRAGERHAARYLKKQGHKLLLRNYCCPSGEIDLVMRDCDTIVFVEVKTHSAPDDAPEEKVNCRKRNRLTRVAESFLDAYQHEKQPPPVDVLTVQLTKGQPPKIKHYADAF
jgi:putative endonuclease